MAPFDAPGPRYHIVEVIGRGGMGEVCLADDVMLDRQVALKFVTTHTDDDTLAPVLAEARAAAALDHPFICAIYEVTSVGGRPCIAMEFVRGESLERRLRAGPLPLPEVLRVADEIAEALDAAHKRRVVHRDLKPANVMLTADGHIKVMDFGLAARLPHHDAPAPMEPDGADVIVRGTPAYMAPEQIGGKPADRRSDIFAFGTLLYQMASGSNPFVRMGIDATLTAIVEDSVAPLHGRIPAFPRSLDGLLQRLLAKSPAMRPQSFADVRTELRRVAADLATVPLASPAVAADADDGAQLVGRDAERARLLQAIDSARACRGGLVVLLGEAGMGKSWLAEDALAAARRRGCQTLTGRCHEQDGTPALIPFIEILEEAARLMPAATFRQAIGPSAPELTTLLPELHRLFPDMAAPLDLPPQLRQRFLFTNVREFLTRASRQSPLVLLIEDVQWADETTLLLTQQLAPQLAQLPILMLLAYREVETAPAPAEAPLVKRRLHGLLDRVRGQMRENPSTPAVKATLDALMAQRHADAIVLRAFTDAGVQAMLAMLGRPNPPTRLVRAFAAHTGGNPFFVAELFRHLNDERRLFGPDNRWKRDVDLDAVRLPESVRVVMERRVQHVSPATLQVLKTAAVIGGDFDLDVLEAVAGVDSDRLMAALDEAERARILRGPSGRRDITWRFAHQLTCQALTSGMPMLRRQRLHAAIADAMTKLRRRSRAHAAAIAHHLYCAGHLADGTVTANALRAAGDAARDVYATEEAVQHYRRTIEVLAETGSTGEEQRDAEETLADMLALLGERAAAMEHYDAADRACREVRATVDAARITRKTGTLHWQAGDRPRALAAYERALDALSGSDADIETAHLYQDLGLAAFRGGDNAKAVEWAERAVQSAEKALSATETSTTARKAATAAIAHATNTVGVALARSGQLQAARERIERSLATAQEVGLLDVACRAYANLGVLYSSVEPARAIQVSLTGLEMASKIGATSLQSYIYANLAASYCALTDRCETEGLEAAHAAVALDRELGQLDHLAVPLVVMAQIHQCGGELQKAQDAYHEALALAEKFGEPQLILPCYDGLATIHLDRGDRVRAEEYMEKARLLCERTGLDPDTLLLLPFLC